MKLIIEFPDDDSDSYLAFRVARDNHKMEIGDGHAKIVKFENNREVYVYRTKTHTRAKLLPRAR